MEKKSQNSLKTIAIIIVPELRTVLDPLISFSDVVGYKFSNETESSKFFQDIVKEIMGRIVIPGTIKFEYLKVDTLFKPLNLYTELILNGSIPLYYFLDDKINIKYNDKIETIEFKNNKIIN